MSKEGGWRFEKECWIPVPVTVERGWVGGTKLHDWSCRIAAKIARSSIGVNRRREQEQEQEQEQAGG